MFFIFYFKTQNLSRGLCEGHYGGAHKWPSNASLENRWDMHKGSKSKIQIKKFGKIKSHIFLVIGMLTFCSNPSIFFFLFLMFIFLRGDT